MDDEILVFSIAPDNWLRLGAGTSNPRPFWQVRLITNTDPAPVDPLDERLEAITSLRSAPPTSISDGVRMASRGVRFTGFKKGVLLTLFSNSLPPSMDVNVWQRGGNRQQQAIEKPTAFETLAFSLPVEFAEESEDGEYKDPEVDV